MRYCNHEVTVYTPIHVTGFFKPCYSADDILHSGSIGAGLTLNKFIVVKARAVDEGLSTISITYTGYRPAKGIDSVEYVVEHYKRVLQNLGLAAYAEIFLPVRVGLGYGVSAAAALGLSTALAVLTKSLTMVKAAQIAHIAEVKALTGLGDVIAEFFGGPLVVRLSPGPPGIGVIDKIVVPASIKIVVLEAFNGMTTKDLVLDVERLPRNVVEKLINDIIEKPSIDTYVESCKTFNDMLGTFNRLSRRIMELLSRIKALGFHIKKNLLVLYVENSDINDVIDVVAKYGIPYKVFSASHQGIVVRCQQ